MSDRLPQQELHRMFLHDIDDFVESTEDNGKKPLCLRLAYPYNRDLNVYIFNCTAPPGGRSIDEFKVQLILDGQKRGDRGKFEMLNGRTTLIVGYAAPFVDINAGLWVLFELDKHLEFAYSANIQVYLRQLLRALEQDVYVCVKHNFETLVISRRKYLPKALQTRFNIDLKILLERAERWS